MATLRPNSSSAPALLADSFCAWLQVFPVRVNT